ncbi:MULTISPECIES: cation:dicarboxylate symporter family transporter [unclassified Sphingobium]|uniref:cation:dicarboxylate symporter family transporter n=1 Tax=unclassified Sphingobium TaxID=2611147 RepID=UPI00119BC771|nr:MULTISPECIES: cation:dicarboxylase symporter family transporter [unclassified Sphingobium]MBG6120493.1 Na+/H+-dicarboxylate symporter [Sphingobium sp. JAI105]TWC98142.1 Na+/H+-dicarboxylate symporter [Sphingobium sp. AEW010]TWD17873.1 Na+/H+-dicarboxylate symporter [Sphingobium sp. AEW013]TWD20616.1 Na+/H+-dicarboxylate symporter [Sphingobium sp. AEW001]
MFRQLYVQMVVGVLAGTALGYVWPDMGVALAPLGLAFIKIMRMMVPPILFCTIVDGIVLHGGAMRTGSTIVRALAIFLAITMLALLSGLIVGTLMQPGAGLNLRSVAMSDAAHSSLSGPPINGPGDFLLRMIPDTFFSAFTAGDVLPVLFIAALVGFGLIRIGPAGEPIAKGLRALTQLQFAIFGFLVRLAPIGAFGATAYTVGAYGIGFIGSLGMLVATLGAACLVLALVLVATVQLATGLYAWTLIRHFRDELLIVVGTSSSEVVLPRLITKLEAMGVSPAVVGLTVPLGYTLNLAGTAVYLVVATLFLSEALEIPLSPDRLALYLAVMLATSKTAAGVTGSGFSALLLTLSLLPDIPIGATAMLIAVDRILSPMRATTSGLANISATLLVARWSGTRIGPIRPPAKPPSKG